MEAQRYDGIAVRLAGQGPVSSAIPASPQTADGKAFFTSGKLPIKINSPLLSVTLHG
jgi:hypothetical protein